MTLFFFTIVLYTYAYIYTLLYGIYICIPGLHIWSTCHIMDTSWAAVVRRINKSEYIVSKGSNVTDEVHSCRHTAKSTVPCIPHGWKSWRGNYSGRLVVLRAIHQYFICQKLQCDVIVIAESWLSRVLGLQLDAPVQSTACTSPLTAAYEDVM